MQVLELAALSRPAYAALWRFLARIDLVSRIDYEGAGDQPTACWAAQFACGGSEISVG
nr:hypothetical protein [Streptomyces yunnanensis]